MIYIIRERAILQQIQEMLQDLETYIKLAVDIERQILAGGGTLHADCEAVLLQDGSQQVDIWGADWHPETRTVTFESIINLRPRQQNFSMEVQDPALRNRIETIVRGLLEVA